MKSNSDCGVSGRKKRKLSCGGVWFSLRVYSLDVIMRSVDVRARGRNLASVAVNLFSYSIGNFINVELSKRFAKIMLE